MLLKQNLSLYRVFKITWYIDLIMLALCTIAYFVDTRVLSEVHLIAALPTLIGTAIAFFIAFNNNQSYSRWWEARIIWGGLVNDSRSWARTVLAHIGPVRETDAVQVAALKRQMVRRHIGFLYALKTSLRKVKDDGYLHYLPAEDLPWLVGNNNIPNALLDRQAYDLEQLSAMGAVDGFRFKALNELLNNFCDSMGKSERINNTVFPTTYIYFTRLFIWMLVILVTMTLTESVGVWSIFFSWLIGFVYHTSHLNGMSLMNPFDGTPSSVPLNSITRTIEINLLQSLGEKELPGPEPTIRNGEYIL